MTEILISIVSCLIGVLIGHRFSLLRDHRIEFNTVSEPIFEELEKQLFLIRAGIYPNESELLSQYSLIRFKRFLSPRKRKKFEMALERYEKALKTSKSQKDSVTDFHSPSLIASSIIKLQEFLKRR